MSDEQEVGRLLAWLSSRQGVSLDYRQSGTDWPGRWRAQSVTNKEERYDYRQTAYGETAVEALEKLVDQLTTVSKANGNVFEPYCKPKDAP